MKKEILQKFYSQYRLYIFPIVVAISSLILIGFVIYPQISALINSSRKETDVRNKLKVMEAKAQVLENYDEADLARKVDFTLAAYPQEKDFTTTVALLQKLTSESGFNIITLGLGGSRSETLAQQSYNVKLEILGLKTLLTNLVGNIETSSRIMRVSTIEITSTREANVISAVLGIEVLFSSLSASFGSLDSPLPTLSQKEEELITKLAATIALQAPSYAVPLGPRGKANPFE